jgi:hypothetical protein
LLYVVFGKQLPNGRNQFKRNLHHSPSLISQGSFVFSDRFIFRLVFVMSKHSLHPFCIPTWGKLLFHLHTRRDCKYAVHLLRDRCRTVASRAFFQLLLINAAEQRYHLNCGCYDSGASHFLELSASNYAKYTADWSRTLQTHRAFCIVMRCSNQTNPHHKDTVAQWFTKNLLCSGVSLCPSVPSRLYG